MKHKIGEIIEWAFWMTGEETQSELRDFTDATKMAHKSYEQEEHVMLSQPVARVVRPGEERCPPVPDHIHGADVQLLVFEARVLLDLPGEKPNRFADELEKDDFNRLAKITREQYARYFPRYPRLSDGQVRTIINDLGPDVALETLRGRVGNVVDYIQ